MASQEFLEHVVSPHSLPPQIDLWGPAVEIWGFPLESFNSVLKGYLARATPHRSLVLGHQREVAAQTAIRLCVPPGDAADGMPRPFLSIGVQEAKEHTYTAEERQELQEFVESNAHALGVSDEIGIVGPPPTCTRGQLAKAPGLHLRTRRGDQAKTTVDSLFVCNFDTGDGEYVHHDGQVEEIEEVIYGSVRLSLLRSKWFQGVVRNLTTGLDETRTAAPACVAEAVYVNAAAVLGHVFPAKHHGVLTLFRLRREHE
jgi:hypothetical protein